MLVSYFFWVGRNPTAYFYYYCCCLCYYYYYCNFGPTSSPKILLFGLRNIIITLSFQVRMWRRVLSYMLRLMNPFFAHLRHSTNKVKLDSKIGRSSHSQKAKLVKSLSFQIQIASYSWGVFSLPSWNCQQIKSIRTQK